jgi:hypothetical protein
VGDICTDENEKKWLHHVRKIFNAVHSMDKNKYLEPRFSSSIYPLIKFLNKRYGGGESSVISNMSKFTFKQTENGSLCTLLTNENSYNKPSLGSLGQERNSTGVRVSQLLAAQQLS